MTVIWVLAAAAVGALVAPVLRARVFHHRVQEGQPWRRDCPDCGRTLIRGVATVLPPSGRCPHCRGRIGPAPFTVEGLTATAFAVLALRVDQPLVLAALCWLAAIGIALSFVDVSVHRLPDQLTYASYGGVLALLAVAAAVDREPGRLGLAVLCGLGMAASYLVLTLVNPAGMGLGDVKLALSIGTALGWFGWVVTVLGAAAGFLLAGLVGAALLVLGKATRKTQLPHGPFMLFGALATLVVVAYSFL